MCCCRQSLPSPGACVTGAPRGLPPPPGWAVPSPGLPTLTPASPDPRASPASPGQPLCFHSSHRTCRDLLEPTFAGSLQLRSQGLRLPVDGCAPCPGCCPLSGPGARARRGSGPLHSPRLHGAPGVRMHGWCSSLRLLQMRHQHQLGRPAKQRPTTWVVHRTEVLRLMTLGTRGPKS